MRHEYLSKALSVALNFSLLICHLAFSHSKQIFAQEPAADRSSATVSRNLLPTGQRIFPVGDTLAYAGQPVAVAMGRGPSNGQVLVKDMKSLGVVDVDNFEWIPSLPLPEGASLTGLVVSRSTGRIIKFKKS